MIKSFFAALSFISRLPVPARLSQGLEIEQYQRSIITFPLVGLLLGAIAGAVVMLLQPWCGGPLAALLGVLALALLTGGFHLDGLADTCDGIFSARRRERMLEIMRDSRLGTHGGLALIFVLVAKGGAARHVGACRAGCRLRRRPRYGGAADVSSALRPGRGAGQLIYRQNHAAADADYHGDRAGAGDAAARGQRSAGGAYHSGAGLGAGSGAEAYPGRANR